MKKLLIIISFIFILFTSYGCANNYNGKGISRIEYDLYFDDGSDLTSIECFAVDFTLNEYLVLDDPYNYYSNWSCKNKFDEKQERYFINRCYQAGLFDIKEAYYVNYKDETTQKYLWVFRVYFEDGTSKLSHGRIIYPKRIFEKCQKYFYDICGEEVLSTPTILINSMPNINIDFKYIKDNNTYYDQELTTIFRGNYKWKLYYDDDTNYFVTNNINKVENKFISGINYKLIIDYDHYVYDTKLNKILVKEYDFDYNLSNEKVLFEEKKFDIAEIDLTFNKIYIIELVLDNGYFVQYSFNTVLV